MYKTNKVTTGQETHFSTVYKTKIKQIYKNYKKQMYTNIWLTCLVNILYPKISTSNKQQPMYGYEEKAHHVWCQCNANKKHCINLKYKNI